jgi:NAD(P)H dehydrogenase (quinone)
VYELAGDRSFTLRDLAAEVSRQSGTSIPYRNLPEGEYASALQGFGLPEGMAKAYAAWDTSASRDALYDDGRQLSKLFGRPTTPMSATVTDTLKRSA